MGWWRRSVAVLAAVAVMGGGVVAVSAQAQTSGSWRWGYLDRDSPRDVFLDPRVDAPVGVWGDGHVGRSYFRFDLAPYRGSEVLAAHLRGRETWAACGGRAVQVWRTEPLTRGSSWQHPPKELELVATGGPVPGQCLADPFAVDATAAVKAAVARGEAEVTFEVRVPRRHEDDPAYGRGLANDLALDVDANRPPAPPTGARIAPDLGCDPAAPGRHLNPALLNDAGAVVFAASATDPDGDPLTAEFTSWPAADPAARQSLRWPVGEDGEVRAQADDWFSGQEGTFGWSVRVLDAVAASPETAPCYFTIDRTAPPTASVSSQVYRPWSAHSGGVGVPGDFTFTTDAPDVVAYRYRFEDQGEWTTVPTQVPGGPVTVTHTPQEAGPDSVEVVAVDRAGNRSWSQYYGFGVFENRPSVWSAMYPSQHVNPQGGVGVPGRFEFSSGLPDVAGFTYQVDDGPATTVPATPQRTAAATFTPTRGGPHVMTVRSVDSAGVSSPAKQYPFLVDTAPTATATGQTKVGSTVRFRFTPRQADVASYTYWFSHHSGPDTEPVTLPAGPDGAAEFTWVPLNTDRRALIVRSTDARGVDSTQRYLSLSVDGASPSLTLTGARYPGVPGTLQLFTSMENAVEFEYWVQDTPDARFTAPATNGRATAAVVSDRVLNSWIIARARNADGVWSMTGSTMWSVTDAPTVTSAEFPRWPEVPWRAGTFTFTSHQPGAVTLECWIDGSVRTAPIDANGTATVTWTPSRVGVHQMHFTTLTADGRRSGQTWYSFTIQDKPLITSGDFPDGYRVGPLDQPATFAVAPGRLGVVEYEYRFHRDDAPMTEPRTIAAEADGTARIVYAPPAYGAYVLIVRGRMADGALTADGHFQFDQYRPWEGDARATHPF